MQFMLADAAVLADAPLAAAPPRGHQPTPYVTQLPALAHPRLHYWPRPDDNVFYLFLQKQKLAQHYICFCKNK